MLNAILVDDEASGLEALQILIGRFCPGVKIVGSAPSADVAEKLIREHKPDLVFLDIEMPFANGFDLLKRFDVIDFDVIFTTAYDHYAVQAFKHSAIDYLLKPVDSDELITAVGKCKDKGKHGNPELSRLESIIGAMAQNKPKKKLSVSTVDGIIFLDSDQIIRLSADSNYTSIYLTNGKKVIASKTLKEFDEILLNMNFFRVHNTHLINLMYVEKYTKGEGGTVTMIDNSEVDVSRNKKNELLSLMSLNKMDGSK